MSPFRETRMATIGRESELLASLGIIPPSRGHRRCPFPDHEDRNPSWRFDFRSARYHCSCSKGDLFDLVRRMGHAHNAASALAFIRDALALPAIGFRRSKTASERAEWAIQQTQWRAKAEAHRLGRASEDAAYAESRRSQCREMFCRSLPGKGTAVERYIREHRQIECSLPAPLRFLAPHSAEYKAAMLAPFALATEAAPGELTVAPRDIAGLHLTFIELDGRPARDNRGTRKKTLGVGHSLPIILAPPNDSLGLVIAEGIEDALAMHGETGLGAWAAGTAGRLPGLAKYVPNYIESVTVIEDDNAAGRNGCLRLADALSLRGIEVRIERGGREAGHAA